jgi:hypothetical protein
VGSVDDSHPTTHHEKNQAHQPQLADGTHPVAAPNRLGQVAKVVAVPIVVAILSVRVAEAYQVALLGLVQQRHRVDVEEAN